MRNFWCLKIESIQNLARPCCFAIFALFVCSFTKYFQHRILLFEKESDLGEKRNKRIGVSLPLTKMEPNQSPGQMREQLKEQDSTSMVCKYLLLLATLFNDKFHVQQCLVLFKNCLMKVKTFLKLFHVLQMFFTVGHLTKHFEEHMRF